MVISFKILPTLDDSCCPPLIPFQEVSFHIPFVIPRPPQVAYKVLYFHIFCGAFGITLHHQLTNIRGCLFYRPALLRIFLGPSFFCLEPDFQVPYKSGC